MANELSRTCSFTAAKGSATIASGSMSLTSNMTGTYMGTTVQSVGTANEVLAFSADITGHVHITIKNTDPTNYVEIFIDSGNTYVLSKLLPGEFCQLCNVDKTKLFARANTADAYIQFNIAQI